MGSAETPEITNPIAEAATEIKTGLGRFIAKDLEGAFPRNWRWKQGDTEIIHVSTGERVHRSGSELVWTKDDGIINKGWVPSYVGNDYSKLEFREAALETPTDLDTVKYGPELLRETLVQLVQELPREEEPQRVKKALSGIPKGERLLLQLEMKRRQALSQMTGPTVLSDEEIELIERRQVETDARIKETKKLEKAFTFYEKRHQIIDQIAAAASHMRAPVLREEFKSLVELIKKRGLFPDNFKDETGKAWIGRADRLTLGRLESRHEYREWVISENGEILERRPFKPDGPDSLRQCPEHFLEQAKEIAGFLLEQSIKTVYEKLKIGYEEAA